MEQREIHRNVHGQEGQGNWIITLCAAFAVAYSGCKNPYSLPIPDDVIYKLVYIASLFSEEFKKTPNSNKTCLLATLAGEREKGCFPK